MERPLIFTIIAPARFISTLAEFEILLEEDSDFQLALTKIDNRYAKKNKQNRLRSAKIRYVIGKYVRENKYLLIEKLKQKKQGETNAKTEIVDKKEKDI